MLKILREENLSAGCSVLEIGSGPIGLGEFRKVAFVGCDISFPSAPLSPMIPIVASACALPFTDRSFEVAIASDVLEHVPPAARPLVIQETLRVTRRIAIFAFPCGQTAHKTDKELLQTYVSKNLEPPVWLQEHMLHDFPEANLFSSIPAWEIKERGNENVHLHLWILRMEMHRVFNYAARACLRIVPRFVEFLLRKADREPFYRRVFVLRRKSDLAKMPPERSGHPCR
jgi:SAM-dependent methyltransferase